MNIIYTVLGLGLTAYGVRITVSSYKSLARGKKDLLGAYSGTFVTGLTCIVGGIYLFIHYITIALS